MNERSKNGFYLISVLLLLISASPGFGVEETTESLTLTLGDTFAISRSIESSFHEWQLEDYDVRKLSLVSQRRPDVVGDYRFVFETLETGQTDLNFTKVLNTELSSETLRNHNVSVTVEDPLSEGTESEDQESQDQTTQEPDPQPSEPQPDENQPTDNPPPSEESVDLDLEKWNEAQDLIETGNYSEARDLIDKRIGRTAGRTRQRWLDLKAKSHVEQEQYGEAIEIWERMVDDFVRGPKGKWLTSIADAHEANGAMDQAELALLQIRHQHKDSRQWPEAMNRLADMAIQREEYKRAKEILQEARSRLRDSNHPEIVMKLAEVYDRYPSTRNYYRAVKLYENAARRFDGSDTRSNKASDRADYLRENFLNFGTQ